MTPWMDVHAGVRAYRPTRAEKRPVLAAEPRGARLKQLGFRFLVFLYFFLAAVTLVLAFCGRFR